MSLHPDKIELAMQLSRALREWSRKKIDPNIKGPESRYEGSLSKCLVFRKGGNIPVGPGSGFDGTGKVFYLYVLKCLHALDPIEANKVEIQINALTWRAEEVDKGNEPPEFVQDLAAEIAKGIEDIVRRETQPSGGDKTGDMIKPQAKEGHGDNAEQNLPKTRYSIDFRSVHWFGTDYSFTPNQAAAVKILWEAWENRTPDVGGDTIATEAESDSRRARDIFKRHPAFGSMICQGKTKGTFRLVEPDK